MDTKYKHGDELTTATQDVNLQRVFGRICRLGLCLQNKNEDHREQSQRKDCEVVSGFYRLDNKKRKYSLAYHQHDELAVSVNQVINIGRDIPISNIALHVSQETT